VYSVSRFTLSAITRNRLPDISVPQPGAKMQFAAQSADGHSSRLFSNNSSPHIKNAITRCLMEIRKIRENPNSLQPVSRLGFEPGTFLTHPYTNLLVQRYSVEIYSWISRQSTLRSYVACNFTILKTEAVSSCEMFLHKICQTTQQTHQEHYFSGDGRVM
jgi:hypothetical protein